MPTAAVSLTATPTQVTITAGSSYLLQNPWDNPVYVATVSGNTAPSGAALATRFELDALEFVTLATQSGESMWAWCDDPGLSDGGPSGRVVYQQA